MKRWCLKNIILYNYKQEREILEFDTKGVTIITGKSSTGKSLIVEIIDYTLGSSQCNLPDILRPALSWVGVVLEKDEDQILILRKVNKQNGKVSNDFYYESGKNLKVPQSKKDFEEYNLINDKNLKFKLDQAFNIGDIKNNYLENEYRETSKVSMRYLMSYLLQDDSIIINKNHLLRGLDSSKKNNICEAGMYFLGIIDEDYIKNRERLKKLKRDYDILKRKKERSEARESEKKEKLERFFLEANLLGISEFENDDFDSFIKKIKEISTLSKENKSIENNCLINEITSALQEKREEVSSINLKLENAEIYLNEATSFEKVNNRQVSKLKTISAIKAKGVIDSTKCPLCRSEVNSRNETINKINLKLKEMSEDISDLNSERPKIDDYIEKLKKDKNLYMDEIKKFKYQLRDLIKENEKNDILKLEERQNQWLGKVKFILEEEEELNEGNFEELDSLEEEIKDLELLVGKEAFDDNLFQARDSINSIASEILGKLPLDESYRKSRIDLNLRNYDVSLKKGKNKFKMKTIGSDMNYLSLHLSLLLAIHKYIDELEKPYPSFLVLDQISRPFFPEIREVKNIKSNESEHKVLKQYFDCLFEEVEESQSLQLIILEHAYFEEDSKFRNATKYRWREINDGLIPNEWLKEIKKM